MPLVPQSCCPPYTIRLDVDLYKQSKKQRQVMRRLARYLEQGDIHEVAASAKDSASHVMTMDMIPAVFNQESYELYKRYQVAVHGDKPEDISEKSFSRFLIESPLCPDKVTLFPPPSPVETTSTSSGSEKEKLPCGTYHMNHYIDGRLLAVSVLDLVPSGVSSVYCFYDPDDKILSLGKVTAILEINYAKEMGYNYYYMGYYIHNCAKMNYKAEYSPSELLCPSTFTWQPFKEASKHLDKRLFTPLQPQFAEKWDAFCVENSADSSDDLPKTNEDNNGASSSSATDKIDSTDAEDTKKDDIPVFAQPCHMAVDMMKAIPLLVMKDRPAVSLLQLTQSGQDYLRPLLEEWIRAAGPEVPPKFVLSFV